MRYWFSCLFVLLLLVPAIVGLPGNASMKHNPISAPGLAAANFKTPEYYRAWKTFLKQRLSDLPQAARAKNWLDYRLFAMSDHGSIHVGRAGWLFSKQDIAAFRKGDCDDAAGAARLHLELNVLARLLKKAGKHFAFVVSPGKATLYPEYLGKVPAAGHCGKSFLDLLLEEQARQSVDGFLQLEGPLKKAKENGTAIYGKTGGVMSQAGARIAARVLLGQLFGGRGPDTTRGRPGGDLAAALLDPQLSGNTMAGVPATSVPATALVYGSREAGVLLPELAPHFERVDMMMGPTLPSLNHGESPGNYEAVIVVLPESKLAAFQIDLNRLCALLGAGGLADHRSSLPLKTLRSRGHLSLELVDQQLAVKSLGADSFFALPALPGSDAATLRLLELVISSARADALTWFIGDAQAFKGEDALRPGTNKIYIPMPQGRTARVRVNPGQYAGLFYLEGVKLLEYEGPAGQSGLDATRTPAGIPLQADGKAAPARPAPVPEDAQSALSQGMEEAASPPAIHLNEFEDGCIFQRRGEVADIVVSGTYEGHPAAVEARVLSYGTDEPVTAWTQIDATPRQGVFMGILPEVPQGGWYRMAVRFRDNIDIAGRGEARWGVGILAACIGQSNMKEWFHSGDSLTAHSLLSVHREGHWRPGALTGNGAIAFGNRLIGRLGVPVGLLDYAVNGSGLRKEADWGTGYWTDRSPDGIYQRFIRDLSAAGGALEYVLFMQGEADAARATISESQYLDALENFIAHQVRKDAVNGSLRDHLPFLILGMPKRPVGKDLPHQAIRRAQRTAARDIADCYLAAASLDLTNRGRQHLAPEAYTKLGLRAAQTVLFLLGQASYYQGPQVSGAYQNGPDKIDILLSHHGGTDFGPAKGISGWEVIGRQGPVEIAGVVRLDAATLRIELASPAPGPLTVRYLYGARPDTSAAVHDNSPMELPLDPFEGVVR